MRVFVWLIMILGLAVGLAVESDLHKTRNGDFQWWFLAGLGLVMMVIAIGLIRS
jgi:hypothetical protein